MLGVTLAWLDGTYCPLPVGSCGRRWRLPRWRSPAFVPELRLGSVAVPSLHGLSAGVFLSVLAYYPFIYMPVAAVLRRLDPHP
ncbi:iron ABC transporter permease [Klebsiella pneumoniae]|uniref:Iron ABC transporter permease n=1 Tax=Klebsiella pneumoniae TaxID=573 RepID=A0A378F6W3_KLEPN|nr:iron ABC transporter permease [Klebsiella pneumoniae]